MADGKKGADGVDAVTSLFPAGSHKMIQRLLQRAMEKEARDAGWAAGEATRGAVMALDGHGGGGDVFARELAKALRHRGDLGSSRASVRQKSPTSGGRPFHFAHSVVTKSAGGTGPGSGGGTAKGAPSSGCASGAAPTPGGGPSGGSTPAAGGLGKVGRAAAHMRYIERAGAVELADAGRAADPVGAGRATGAGRDGVEGDGREPEVGGRELGGGTAGAGQAYIENEAKLENGERVVFSFGTIGDTFDERTRFWQALEEAEAHPSARVQHRLIVELPHEASPAARHEIVRAFCAKFEEDGVPYWAALHAPGPKNDDRNFHAHIVYSERPAARMKDPNAPGSTVWDFEVLKRWTDSSRHARVSRPHRQDKVREYNARGFIKERRKAFADAANAVLRRDGVKDAKGEPVVYDARSYADMGVEAVPIRSINRIVADRLKDGRATVLDGDYTQRLVAAELREAAARRDKGVLELVALDNALRAMAASDNPQAHNRRVPKDMRVSPWAQVPKDEMRAAARKVMEARHAALQVDVLERASVASLERIVAATDPKVVAAAGAARDPTKRAAAPDAAAAAILHAAAVEELAETRASSAKARRSLAYKVGQAANAWRELVAAPPTPISPETHRVIRELDALEDERRRAARGETPAREGAAPRAASEAGRPRDARQEVGPGTERSQTGPASPVHPASPAHPAPEAPARSAGGTPTAAPGPARRTDARAPARAHGRPTAGTGPARPAGGAFPSPPRSMEDALGMRGPPTNSELAAASAMVSARIKAVMDAEPDHLGRRLELFDDMLEDWLADIRERKGLPPKASTHPRFSGTPSKRTPPAPAMGDGTRGEASSTDRGDVTGGASTRSATTVAAGAQGPGAVATPEPRGTPATASASAPGSDAAGPRGARGAEGGTTAPVATGPAASDAAMATGGTPVAPPPELLPPDAPVVTSTSPSPTGGPVEGREVRAAGAGPASPPSTAGPIAPVAGTTRAGDAAPPSGGGGAPQGASGEVAEHPDDAKRRRKRLTDEEERKKAKRKAVLAKSKRGRQR